MSARAAVVRVGVLAAMLLGSALSAPTGVRTALAAIALVSLGQTAAALFPGGDSVDRVLLSAFAVVALSLPMALLLNYLPGGINHLSLAIGWTVIGLVLLALVAIVGAGDRLSGLPATRTVYVCAGLIAAGAAVAFVIAMNGVHQSERSPLLSLSALRYGGHQAEFDVSSVNKGGTFSLTVLPDGATEGSVTRRVSLPAAGTHSDIVDVSLPASRCYWRIVLRKENARSDERTVKLWIGTESSGLLRTGGGQQPLGGRARAQGIPSTCRSMRS